MLWDHCMMVIMYTKGEVEQGQGMFDVKDPIKFIGFYYADIPDLPPMIAPPQKILGLIPTDEEVQNFPALEESEEITRDYRPDFLSFSNFGDAMLYLSSTGWEAVSHSKVVDRYDDNARMQIHENLLFKRRVL